MRLTGVPHIPWVVPRPPVHRFACGICSGVRKGYRCSTTSHMDFAAPSRGHRCEKRRREVAPAAIIAPNAHFMSENPLHPLHRRARRLGATGGRRFAESAVTIRATYNSSFAGITGRDGCRSNRVDEPIPPSAVVDTVRTAAMVPLTVASPQRSGVLRRSATNHVVAPDQLRIPGFEPGVPCTDAGVRALAFADPLSPQSTTGWLMGARLTPRGSEHQPRTPLFRRP